ncbi:MAG: hypothetical protein A2X03_18810 [Bacteroidetes bacterium GWA2_40_15]|nr:MAG: hypothetical protein A2X03_18810 [Bacteroidetes bacterium GWA2_40_15]
MNKNESHITRRNLLRNSALAGLGGALMPLTGMAVPDQKKKKTLNLIEAENSKPGTVEWQLQFTGFDTPVTMASYPMVRYLRSLSIEGFVSKTSVLPGESIEFKVSMDPPGNFFIDIYRMGYYAGTGGRHMVRLGSFPGSPQSLPMMTIERLRECNWETATTFTIPNDWLSGVYLGKLSRDEPFGKQSYVIFVVKEHRKSDVLCQVSDLTWQAYNKWPGRDSLYDDGSTSVWYTGPNVRVSFDRPYAKYGQLFEATLSAGSGEYLLWEHPMTYWLEQQGYDVAYCSNLDLHFDPDILNLSKVFLSVGHDEYWTRKMYEEATRARDNGLSLAFFSGNTLYLELSLFDSFNGTPGRVFSRVKIFEDEEKLMGLTSSPGAGVGYGDWVVKNSAHWVYKGTGMKNGDKIPGIIGWEFNGPPTPDIANIEIVAENALSQATEPHAASIYRCPKGNWVFNAGTIWWPEGLSDPPGHIPAGDAGMEEPPYLYATDPYGRSAAAGHNPGGRTLGVNSYVQKITSNILDRMIKDSPR